MAETLITPNSHPDESSDPPALPSIESVFSRKVDFHPAKKPFSGFSNGSGGFRLETLNPTTISDPRRLGASGQGSGQSGLVGKKPDGAEFLDVGLDPELSFGITFRRIPHIYKVGSIKILKHVSRAPTINWEKLSTKGSRLKLAVNTEVNHLVLTKKAWFTRSLVVTSIAR
ncbi:Ubiquitin carboxyl-terminal hydrolase 23 [Camellia lanceoleosa]|uniref:Ubiquitin carboxyl-terminal hydrolase 23 n=1 Tax=Camellia lanceoleosa TaxID=1840588 RepID=A0ACC0I0X4_9ERIC|nr:Ubiquitin carboxyl-terminal hydrolase 23 [Camellia lanceoleosa]